MFSNEPRVKDLLAFLSEQDPEAFILISDGHEGINQLVATVGSVEVDDEGNVTGRYVCKPDDVEDRDEKYGPSKWAPAVQLDSGV